MQSNEELSVINSLLDDRVLNGILSYAGYTPTKRTMFPSQYFRAEVLKSLRHPSLSYQKYCNLISNLSSKVERSFIHLSLHKKVKAGISHSYLSQFRSGLMFSQMVNLSIIYLMVYLSDGLFWPD